MKTPLKELIERIEKQMSAIPNDPNLTERALYDSYLNCKNWATELLDEVHNEKRGDLVRLLRWVLKNYDTGTDIEGMFMWENPAGEEFDSIQVVDHYLKENK
jgi:hypothetical protein